MATDAEVREMTAAQRRDIADLIDGLTDEQLGHPSLCGEWTVKEVATHLTVPLHTSLPKFFVKILAARGSFDRANARLAKAESGRSAASVAKELRDKANHPFTPPGLGPMAPLLDALVHTQDIRRALGLGNGLAPERVTVALGGLADKKFDKLIDRKRFAGLRFEASDLDYTSGDGATVSGTGEAILMAVNGRPSALDDLSGDGVALLRSRFAS